MRSTMIKALVLGALAAALLLPANRAEAATIPGVSGIALAAEQLDAVDKVRQVWVCRNYWNGYRWVRRCRWVTVYYGPYYGPQGPYYYRGGRRYWRR